MIKRNSLKKQKTNRKQGCGCVLGTCALAKAWTQNRRLRENDRSPDIASERYEDEHPCRKDGYMFRTAVKGGGK